MSIKVFISYNHSDQEIAVKLKDYLELHKIQVIIDTDSLMVGDDIKRFIEKSIGESDYTLSIISTKSLTSSWVALETTYTFFHEKLLNRNKFIACFLDNDIFEIDYTDKLHQKITVELGRIQDIIKKRMDDKLTALGIIDLEGELERYRNLSHNGRIIGRLRESFYLNFCSDDLNEVFSKVLYTITKQKEGDKVKIQSGAFHDDLRNPKWQLFDGIGDRIFEKRIDFAESFQETPAVSVSLNGLDVEHTTNLRIFTRAQAVDKNGFNLYLKTWADTKIYSVDIQWIAYGN